MGGSDLENILAEWGINDVHTLKSVLAGISDISAIMMYMTPSIERLQKAKSDKDLLVAAKDMLNSFDKDKYTTSITLGCLLAATAVFSSEETGTYEKNYVTERYNKLLTKD